MRTIGKFTAFCALAIGLFANQRGVGQELLTVEFANGLKIEVEQEKIRIAGFEIDLNRRGPAAGTAIHRTAELIGAEVRSPQGESIGVVEQLLMDAQTGATPYAVIEHRDMEQGEPQLYVVPWKYLLWQSGGPAEEETALYCVLNLEQGTLEGAPSFTADDWPDFSQPRWNQAIEDYYENWQAENAPPEIVEDVTDDAPRGRPRLLERRRAARHEAEAEQPSDE